MIHSHKLNSQVFIPYKSHAFSYEYPIFLGPLKRQSEIKTLQTQGNDFMWQCM